MYDETLEKIGLASKNKMSVLNSSILKYLISSAFAGMFIGIGILLIFTIGSLTANLPSQKILMGVSFAIALSLVIIMGVDLFTGNNMVMTVGILRKDVKVSDAIKLWCICWIGNLIGGIILALLYVGSGLVKGDLASFYEKTAIAKASAPFLALVCKGILCNILVCLAVLSGFRTNDDSAKILMTFMCLFAFITSGFEHSIANMTVYAVGLISPEVHISITDALKNLIPVTVGNWIDGGVIVGGGFYLLKSAK